MNRLAAQDRAKIIHLLCEGMSIRAVTRLTGVSKTTVSKLVVDVGQAAGWYQDRVFQNLGCRKLQIDEVWGFVAAKQKNAANMKATVEGAGDAWLWLATDADTKLVPCWHVGGRGWDTAMQFIEDLGSRLAHRVQITTDGHTAYLEPIAKTFHGQVDYAMLQKIYGPAPEGQRRYSPAECIGAQKKVITGNPDMQHVLC